MEFIKLAWRFEDRKGEISNHISKDRQCNGQKKQMKDKNSQQNIIFPLYSKIKKTNIVCNWTIFIALENIWKTENCNAKWGFINYLQGIETVRSEMNHFFFHFSSNSTSINHEWGKGQIVNTTNGTYPWSFVPQLFRNR